ncbi:unnamed protein product [Rotaria sordida]|uniref:Caspase family p20 domain-containing protein n=1 Tax=Rotaria sordida TaxID=392033 RepID=A0A815BUW8_9BILA|nr:unnamed protein product [Rotaria sordida]
MATRAKPRRKLALVIGIGKYDHCEELQNPENDANDMFDALESIGFIVTKKLDLKRAKMKHVVIDFEESIEPDDMVLFYFAGHGIQWEDQNYLIPRDTPTLNGADLNKSAINAQDILNTLSDRKPYVTIFLLDCCRKYHLRNPEGDARDPDASGSKPVGLKAMHKAGSLIAFACAPGTLAIEGKGEKNGLFTKHLLKHITTTNEDIRMILSDVTDGVIEESKSKQIPFLSASLSKRNIYLYGQRRDRPCEPEQPQDLLQISDQDLQLNEEIGRGAFGIVYRAQWLSQHHTVAVKRKYHLRNPEVNARDPDASDPKSIGLKAMYKAGSLIAFACAPGTIAIEGKGQRNGLFTKHLLKHITTENEDIQMILRDVAKGVTQESKSKQIPFVSAALLERDIYLYSQQTKRPHKPGKYASKFYCLCLSESKDCHNNFTIESSLFLTI